MLVQVTVPQLVSGFCRKSVVEPLIFMTPLLATVNGPPAMVPLFQLNVPVTVLVPPSVAPEMVRLVIVPPWNAGPRFTVPPVNGRFGIASDSNQRLPPV